MSTVLCLTFKDHKYSLQESSAHGSLVRSFSDYTNTGKGIYKTLGVGQKIFEAGVYFASYFPNLTHERIVDFTYLSSWISGARKLLVVTKITSHTAREFFQSIFARDEGISGIVYAFFDLTNDFVSFLRLFRIPEVAKVLFKKGATIVSFTLTTWDIKKSLSEYSFCSSLAEKADVAESAEDREMILTYASERQRYLLMSMAADLIDFALAVLLISGVFFGMAPAIPALVLWEVEAVSFFTKFSSDLYDKMMTYHLKDDGKVSPEERLAE